jgi:DNA (cytosine-5)-methyltransferase 1
MPSYYNENDPKAAAWLRELIKCGHIADGEVDERSIVDVRPDELAGFTQCHFFAGIGGWSYALRLAGWPDDRPVWTGSCPCQPFSVAGKGAGTADARHLWPEFHRLISECRPSTVFGEQVASRAGRDWLATVRADLEALGYAVGAADLCAASVGAPHIRQRLYFVANAEHYGHNRSTERPATFADSYQPGKRLLIGNSAAGLVGNPDHEGPQRHGRLVTEHDQTRRESKERYERKAGFWSDAEWLPCRDGKARCVESGTFPLVARLPKGLGLDGDPSAPPHDSEARVMRLRGYGNAIVAPLAAAFIKAAMT